MMFRVENYEPVDAHLNLLIPFVVCTSKDGPYDDEAFAAGFACGEIHQALNQAACTGRVTALRFPIVRAALLRQLDLIAMHHGFAMSAETDPDYPQWSQVMFTWRGATWPPAGPAAT